MKYFLTILLTLALLLTACGETAPDPSQTSSPAVSEDSIDVSPDESGEESRKEWIETETRGNDVITREYRDGKNDYTVTVETYKDNRLTDKEIRVMSQAVTLLHEVWRYSEDGEVSSYSLNEYDKNGNPVRHAEEYVYSEVIYKSEGTYDADGHLNSTLLYASFDGAKLAEGTECTQLLEGEKCTITNLTVYDADGKIDHTEIRKIALATLNYNYWEYLDADGKTQYLRIERNDYTEFYRVGEKGGKLVIDGTEYTFTELDGSLIAKGTNENANLTLHTIGEGYTQTSVIERVNELSAFLSEPQNFFLYQQ